MPDYILYGWFSAGGEGKSGLTPLVDVRDRFGTLLVSDGDAFEIGGGLYGYAFSSATIQDYLGVFKTSDMTVDNRQYPAMFSQQLALIDDLPEEIRIALSTLPAVALNRPQVGDEIETIVGDTYDFEMDIPGDLTGAKKIYLNIKRRYSDADSASILMLEQTAGLMYIYGAAATEPLNGSLTVVTANPGKVRVRLAAVESSKVAAYKYYYGVKVVASDDTVETRILGEWEFISPITKAIS